MEHHGKNPSQNVIAIVPARFSSVRLPGKLLLPIGGKPLVVHTMLQARKAQTVSRVIVATDDQRIVDSVVAAGGEAIITSGDHRSGTDRVAEVAAHLEQGSIIVNVQGDEPLIAPETIDVAVQSLIDDDEADMATTSEPIKTVNELLNGNVVKVVTGESGYALYFSRSPMPYPRDASLRHGGDPVRAVAEQHGLMSIFRKHTGLYVYRREYLLKLSRLPQTRLEKIEMLEQLRALDDGAKIRVVEAARQSIGVDTDEDFERVRILIEEMPITYREASEDDVGEVSQVYVETVRRSFATVYPWEYLNSLSVERREKIARERFASPNYGLVVAESATGRLVGFADFGAPVLNGASRDRQIYSIYMLPEFQRLGIGRRLFLECVSRILGDGAATLCLDTVEASPYRQFYDGLGGSIVGTGSHRFGDTEMPTVIYGWDDLSQL